MPCLGLDRTRGSKLRGGFRIGQREEVQVSAATRFGLTVPHARKTRARASPGLAAAPNPRRFPSDDVCPAARRSSYEGKKIGAFGESVKTGLRRTATLAPSDVECDVMSCDDTASAFLT